MHAVKEKTQLQTSLTIVPEVPQLQSERDSGIQFEDNRTENIAFQKMQVMANGSPRVTQLQAIQDMANNSPRTEELTQLQSKANYYTAGLSQPIQKKENNTGLPDHLKLGVENLSGYSMDDVKVHRNSDKPAQLNAHAFAQGTDIHLASGQEKHLPHEAWHVVQQKQGRVKPTLQLKGKINVNDDTGLEKEADIMGVKALMFSRSGDTSKLNVQRESINSVSPNGIVQRQINHDQPNFQPKGNRAGSVLVENIRGAPYGPSANAPNIDVFGWPELKGSGDTLGNQNSTHYNAVRMHLWNGRLGGPGNDYRNLAPGPATVNSSMSAGPETAAKDAVSADNRIWLRAEVWYQGNNANANDYTSVVPNRMEMQWGYMLNQNNTRADRFAFGQTHRGPGQPVWVYNPIPQPQGAMTAARIQQYTDLALLPAIGRTLALDNLLQNTSDQEQAQAYELVGPTLKKHLLLNYPSIYFGIADTAKGAVLSGLTVQEIHNLKVVLGLGDYKVVYNEIMVYMFGSPGLLLQWFQGYNQLDQISLIQYSKGELLQYLGQLAIDIAKVSKPIFNLLPNAHRFQLLDNMDRGEISVLLNQRIDRSLFISWANSHGQNTPDEMSAFIRPKVPSAMGNSFNVEMNWLKKQSRPRSNYRPMRNRRGADDRKFNPYKLL